MFSVVGNADKYQFIVGLTRPEQAWLPQTEGGNPEWWRHIALRLRLRGSPLWSRCVSEAPSLFSRNPKWRHCVCSSSALHSAAPICKPAPNSSDQRFSINDTMPSLVEGTVNVSGPGLYITLPLVLRRLGVLPGSGKKWRASPGAILRDRARKCRRAPSHPKSWNFFSHEWWTIVDCRRVLRQGIVQKRNALARRSRLDLMAWSLKLGGPSRGKRIQLHICIAQSCWFHCGDWGIKSALKIGRALKVRVNSVRFNGELTEHPSRIQILATGPRKIPPTAQHHTLKNSYWMLRSWLKIMNHRCVLGEIEYACLSWTKIWINSDLKSTNRIISI